MAKPPISELSPYRVLRDPLEGEPPHGGVPFPPDEDEVHLREYWRVVVKHRSLVLGVLVAAIVSTAAIVLMTAPLYTATATVQIERQAPKFAPVQGVEQVDTLAVDKYDYYQTQFEVLKSRSVAARVIKALSLDGDKRFLDGTAPNALSRFVASVTDALARGRNAHAPAQENGVDPKLIDRYLRMLSIDPVRNSRLVKVGFTSRYPELSSEVANRHVEEFVDSSLDQRLAMNVRAKAFLEQELAKARDRVDAAEAALNRFRKDKDIISLDGEKSDIVADRLEDLNKRFTEAQADRIRLEGQYDLIEKRDYESLPDVASSLLIGQLKQEVAKIEAERAELSKKFKPGYPKMAETIARETEAKRRLDGEIRKIVGTIESSYLAAKAREAELGKQLELQRQAALRQKDVGADFDTLKRDVDTARSLYANLLQRLKDVDVDEENKVTNVSVVDAAAAPLSPSSPKKLLDLLLAAVIGSMGGVGLAFFLEYLDNTLKTPEDVTRRLGLPTLGVVPSFGIPALAYGYSHGAGSRKKHAGKREKEPSPQSGELVVSTHPRSVVAESYRTIRTGILLSRAGKPPQVVMFTSGTSGEGKTVTAVNQAMTLASAGGRVLIIDCDIRKPRLHRIFDLPNNDGLANYLTGQSPLEAVVHRVSVNGHASAAAPPEGEESAEPADGALFVIPSGPLPPNPAELLGSRRMSETLKMLRKSFDYIVLDTPPVLPVTDAVVLSTAADGVVLVVRGQVTPADIAEKSRDRLDYARAKILGVVLNDVDVTSGDYDQYHRYYYAYHADGDETAPG